MSLKHTHGCGIGMGKRDPTGADVRVNRKNIDFFNGEVFLLLTNFLMDDPILSY